MRNTITFNQYDLNQIMALKTHLEHFCDGFGCNLMECDNCPMHKINDANTAAIEAIEEFIEKTNFEE